MELFGQIAIANMGVDTQQKSRQIDIQGINYLCLVISNQPLTSSLAPSKSLISLIPISVIYKM